MAAGAVGEAPDGRAVAHGRARDAGEVPEQRGADVLAGAVAGRGVVEVRRIGTRIANDVRERARRQIITRDQRVREGGGKPDRDEIPFRIVRQIGVETGREREIGRCAEQHRVAVGLGLRDGVGADHRAAAGTVLHDHRLSEQRRQWLAHRARHHVEAAAGRLRHDQSQRPRWKALCIASANAEREHGKMKQLISKVQSKRAIFETTSDGGEGIEGINGAHKEFEAQERVVASGGE